jgi:hypothetical protein
MSTMTSNYSLYNNPTTTTTTLTTRNHNRTLHNDADKLWRQIDEGIHEFGVINHDKYGRIYAYETDGLGGHHLMDDANVPSLLSIPYLGYTSSRDPDRQIELNTRKYVLSSDNPFFFAGTTSLFPLVHFLFFFLFLYLFLLFLFFFLFLFLILFLILILILLSFFSLFPFPFSFSFLFHFLALAR